MDGPLFAITCAIDSVGGVEPLAARLNVSRDEVSRWLSGLETPPLTVAMDALDLIG